jgi:hypothetical protein
MDTPFAANATQRAFSAILTWGIENTPYVERNVVRDVALLPTRARDAIWNEEQRSAFADAAGLHLRRAFYTMLYTVQRTSDVLGLRSAQVCERGGRLWITLRQDKTGTLVALPIHARLAEALAENPLESDMLCPAPNGSQWTYDRFANAWDINVKRANWLLARRILAEQRLPPWWNPKARDAAKQKVRQLMIVGLQRRDLRRTGMVDLALHGVTDVQIASLSGHSIDRTRRILDVYIPRRADLALAAVETWEDSEGKVTALVLRPPRNRWQKSRNRRRNRTANRIANRNRPANR